jgi:hypothetical protein
MRAFTGDDRLVKTLLLSALAPQVSDLYTALSSGDSQPFTEKTPSVKSSRPLTLSRLSPWSWSAWMSKVS